MTPELVNGITGLGILAGALFTGWQSWKARRVSERAETHAARAADNSHPISNGWGTALREDMAAVRKTVERLDEAALLNERRQSQQDDRLQRVEDTVARLQRPARRKVSA